MTHTPRAERISRWLAAGRLAALAWLPLVAGLSTSPADAADLPHPWVQFTATGGLEARAIVAPGMKCPQVMSAKTPLASVVRAEPNEAFPIQVCATPIPTGADRLTVGGLPVPSMPRQVNRVAILGDTGCRLKGKYVQDCNDPAAWPFATVARLAAGRKPDVVIHVGDYHYRETPCPTDRPGCAGSPHGDNWAVWQKDVFIPAEPLFPVAPLVLTRGNHELCDRGGQGWFRTLDPRPSIECVAQTDPYTLSIGPLSLLMLDSAPANDQQADPKLVPVYQEHLKALYAKARPDSWLVTHRPIWAFVLNGYAPVGTTTNATLQAAAANAMPANVSMILSGHIHSFMAYDFGGVRPSQLVVGEGGDAADEIAHPLPVGQSIDGKPIKRGMALGDYGYVLLQRVAGGWDAATYSLSDKVIARCQIRGRSIACNPVKAPS